MRITNNLIQRNALATMQANQRKIADAQRQVSTGLRVQKASDDPHAAAQIMDASGSLRALEQYRKNIQAAGLRTSAAEGVLNRTTDLMIRARELGMSQASATADETSRAAALGEVEQLLAELGGLFDTETDGTPLFPGGTVETEIAQGYLFRPTPTRQELTDTQAEAALTQLRDALSSGSGVDGALAAVEQAFGRVQGVLAETGVRSNQLEVTSANLDALEVNLRTFKSDLEEVDLERAITEMVSRQTSFQAAMLATSRVMGLTLADYLR